MTVLAALVSAVFLPGFVPVSTTAGGGELLSGFFPGAERPGLVYLPPGFTTARRYPVVYLLHGMPGSPSEFPDGTGLLDFAGRRTVRPFIAVMPAAGDRPGYNGEWAGRWENELVNGVVPFVDRNLPTIPTPAGRVLAGLSAGGYGAVDIGLHHPELFGRIESWSGYFRPLHDGPFRDAPPSFYEANDPVRDLRALAPKLRRDRTEFFISSGPSHSHWFKADESVAFAHELHALGLPVAFHEYTQARGEWKTQLAVGLEWALAAAA